MKRDYEEIDVGLDGRPRTFWQKYRRSIIIGTVTFILAVFLTLLIVFLVIRHKDPSNQSQLEDFMTIEKITSHLQKFYDFALENNNTRAMNTTGYYASLDYVQNTLAGVTDYIITRQEFTIPAAISLIAPQISVSGLINKQYVSGFDFGSLSWFQGTYNNTYNISAVANYGCQPEDYANFTAGNIALVRRGVCFNADKLNQALSANAGGLFIFNEGNTIERIPVFIGSLSGQVPSIPVFALSNPVGEILAVISGEVQVHIIADNVYRDLTTWNLIAETKDGSPDSIIVVGSHLDSVPAGPGINDNGSGSGTNLELALQLYETGLVNNLVSKVRFAWWAAEELGLLGSYYYVNNLNQTDPSSLHKIKANLNFDMLGSPNFYRGIYNGSSGAPEIAAGSGAIQNLFEQYMQSQDLPYLLDGFNGRSDYAAFIEVGIPAGGLATGAEGIKTEAETATFGGIANTPYDPCYHQACDTVANVNQEILLQNAQAAAWVLQQLAENTDLKTFLSLPY